MKKQKKKNRIKLGVACALILGLGLIVLNLRNGVNISVESIVSWVEYARATPWLPWLFYVGFVLAVLWLPISLFPIIGGVFFNFWIAFPLNIMAATLGACLAFLIARLFGRDAVKSHLHGRLKSMDKWAGEKGFQRVLVLRWMGLPPFVVANYVLGLSKVRLKDFFWGTLFGILPWMALVTYMSNQLWVAFSQNGHKGLASALSHAATPLVGFSIFVMVSYATVSYLKNRSRKAYSNL